MKISFNHILLILLYCATLLATSYLIYRGLDYYSADLKDRPRMEQHHSWKPGGNIGHGLGVVGSALMLIMLLYSLRKRMKFLRKAGDIRWWLNYHIWMGITGPVLVTFHTSFKFGGIVAVSFWSMAAVALSGVLGRYIYLQIPRAQSGLALSATELQAMENKFREELQIIFALPEPILKKIDNLTQSKVILEQRGLAAIIFPLVSSLILPAKLKTVKAEIKASGDFSGTQLKTILKTVKEQTHFRRKTAYLQTAMKLLHHWHMIHRPFAVVMLVIMIVHVMVTVLFGYRWIF